MQIRNTCYQEHITSEGFTQNIDVWFTVHSITLNTITYVIKMLVN